MARPLAKRSGTDGSLLASLPWTLAALTFAVLPHTPYMPAWITAVFFACAGWRWQIERKRWRLPPTWLRMILALASFLGVLAAYEAISGVGPGSALLAVMAALKLLETRQRRDQFVLLFISIFLIMSSLLREQYLWSLPYLVVGLGLTMTAWLQMSTSRGTGVHQAFRNSSRLLLYAAPLMLAMWVLFPRISTPFWAVPVDTSSGVTGLSDQMSPGDLSSLSLSDAVAFRVTFEDAVPARRDRYWRGLVLNRFNGRTWSGNEPTMGTPDRRGVEYFGEPVGYQVTMEPTRQHFVFALDIPYEWSLPDTFMGQYQQLARAQPIDQRVTYAAVSYSQFRLDPELSEFFRRYYLRLPENSNPQTASLALDMRARAGSDARYIEAVLGKFHNEEYFYTLEPPALGRNPVDAFLFDTRRGFCEHYASAFAVMMRAAGIPSRIVIGYQGGEVNPMGNYMIVRQSDAHAWTEVWLEQSGWTRVDPTAAVAPERIEEGMDGAMLDGAAARWGMGASIALLERLTLTWDSINASWNEWVLGYGPENQTSLLKWLGMEKPDWQKMMLTLLAVVVILVTAISLLLVARYRPPRRDRAAMLYRKFTQKTRLEPARGEPPIAFASRLEGNDESRQLAGEITALYLATRYGSPARRNIEGLEDAVRRYSGAG